MEAEPSSMYFTARKAFRCPRLPWVFARKVLSFCFVVIALQGLPGGCEQSCNPSNISRWISNRHASWRNRSSGDATIIPFLDVTAPAGKSSLHKWIALSLSRHLVLRCETVKSSLPFSMTIFAINKLAEQKSDTGFLLQSAELIANRFRRGVHYPYVCVTASKKIGRCGGFSVNTINMINIVPITTTDIMATHFFGLEYFRKWEAALRAIK